MELIHQFHPHLMSTNCTQLVVNSDKLVQPIENEGNKGRIRRMKQRRPLCRVRSAARRPTTERREGIRRELTGVQQFPPKIGYEYECVWHRIFERYRIG